MRVGFGSVLRGLSLVVLAALAAPGYAGMKQLDFLQSSVDEDADRKDSFSLASPAFADGAPIPTRYTADGADVSPPLAWSGAPAETASFVLIVDDPDAPDKVWTHWVLYNIPADSSSLPEDAGGAGSLPGPSRQGQNDFGRNEYGGPAPPPGPVHRYRFTLYALDRAANFPAGIGKDRVLKAIEPHVLAQTTLTGTYKR